jgi:hypothetical protein
VRIGCAALRCERKRSARKDMNKAFFDELENLCAELAVVLLAQTEVIGERCEFDARGNQAGQAIENRLSIDMRHWVLSIY